MNNIGGYLPEPRQTVTFTLVVVATPDEANRFNAKMAHSYAGNTKIQAVYIGQPLEGLNHVGQRPNVVIHAMTLYKNKFPTADQYLDWRSQVLQPNIEKGAVML